MPDHYGHARIMRDMAIHEHLFDLSRNGLGHLLLDAAAEGMYANLAAGLDADGSPLAALSPAYADWKGRRFPGRGIGELHGLLKDPSNFVGERSITPVSATSEFGVSADAKQELAWFVEGDGRRPARPIHGLTAEAIAKSDELLDDRFGEIG